MTRKFETVKGYDDATLPQRSTAFSAGYDFFAVEQVYVPSLFAVESDNKAKENVERIEELLNDSVIDYEDFMKMIQEAVSDVDAYAEHYKPVLVKTGIKSKFPDNEALFLLNRSSNPKRGLYLATGVSIVDSDYYNNEDNEGHIFIPFINLSQDDYMIEPGDRVAQGVFMNFNLVDDDVADGKRSGGFGSTGE